MSFFALGLLQAMSTAAMLIFSPLWGKAVDRFGSRPILLIGLLIWAPCPLIWLLVPPGDRQRAFVTLVGAPMPAFGGWLVTHLEQAGHPVDLRLTMYLSSVFLFSAAIAAGRLKEPGSTGMRALVFNRVQGRIARLWGMLNQPP